MLAPVDLVGIHDNIALACLTEDPGQLYYRTASGSDNVLQHTARTDTWQLVDITHQDQSGSHTDSFQQGIHQENVYHGHFINDDHIRFQRIFFIPFKGSCAAVVRRHPRQLQKPVDRHCLPTGGFRHPLGCAACRCRQKDLHVLRLKIPDNGIDRGRLTGTRSSRDDQHTIFHCFHHGFSLHLIQSDRCLLLYFRKLFHDLAFFHLTFQIQIMQHLSHVQLHIVILPIPDHDFSILLFHDQFPIHTQIHELGLHLLFLHAQKCRCPVQQILLRKTGMSLSGGL